MTSSSRGAERDRAFTDFARARMPELYRRAWLLCGDSHRAEDLVQETLAKVYVRWGPAIANPAAYAQTALTRTWISQQRRRSSHERPVEHVPERAVAGPDDVLRLTLLAALDELEPLDRAVVVLRYLDDASTEDVARLLDLTNGAVRNRLLRALRRLRERLDLPLSDLMTGGILP
ncbi:SigE family RNA polymerase sigma factor [Nocardioides anomalus]|uniref:SigE family RNA polymerase sigma factor n=1 Tax=Nocardioides anomalus TaxID=2712223 RepID=A0A6G6WAW6_9ACTN|nr:SigE family RNA polymerase sigma factor [Nocardioides anomalus]QIG42180.1 SigE family RNA polymerase sigma factor [Nocardioides anomalus]